MLGPKGKKLRKLFWADEATLVTMGRPPARARPPQSRARRLSHPPGRGPRWHRRAPARLGARPGLSGGTLGCGPGLQPSPPERFHLPVRALGYSLVMDYKETELGRQANSAGAVMVDGIFYCPAMPEVLVAVSADLRKGTIDAVAHA